MSKTLVDIEGSKGLLTHIFEMEIKNITEKIRNESKDDKDKLILQLERDNEQLRATNMTLSNKLGDIQSLVNKKIQ